MFGTLFPFGATLVEVALVQGLTLTPTNVIAVQRTSVLLWIINSAPFVLALVASIPGRQQDALTQLNRRYEEERVEFLEKFPEENPNSVLRVDHSGEVLYGNRAGQALLTEMGNPKKLPEGLKPAEEIFDKYGGFEVTSKIWDQKSTLSPKNSSSSCSPS